MVAPLRWAKLSAPAMTDAILALNAGSSSIKVALFSTGGHDEPLPLLRGQIEDLDSVPHLVAIDAGGNDVAALGGAGASRETVVAHLVRWIEASAGGLRLRAVGHRIVHGGTMFTESCRITPEVVAALTALTPLAPLHQPLGLSLVHAVAATRPNLAQVACFDTAFHRALGPVVSRYAIPRVYADRGVRRYGFHGLSYEFIAGELAKTTGLAAKRTVVAHLGNGASLCAMQHGKSLDTTMGFSTLDGLVMGTRSGAIDPGVLLYLQRTERLSLDALEHMLYHESGMLGVSGLSSDVRVLLASDEPRAREAIELFVFHIVRQIAVMAATLGGLEALVFTGGIGEHAAAIRAQVCERLGWLGVRLDAAANATSARTVNTPESRVEVRIIATNEEMTIARHVNQVLAGGRAASG